MFKKILIIIIAVLAITLIGLFVLAFIISRQSGGEITVRESLREILPFGSDSKNRDFFIGQNLDDIGADLLNKRNLEENKNDDAIIPRLRQITDFPVAGVSVTENKEGRQLIKYIARENGHIFETFADSLTQKRISNTTILRIQDAQWLPSGDAFIARFLDENGSEVESFYAEIKQKQITSTTTDSEGSLSGSFLPKDIIDLSLSKDKNKLFYLIKSGDGSIGIVSETDGSKKVQIFNSQFSEWSARWSFGDIIALTTKPSSYVFGYLYFLNSKNEDFKKILSGIAGLTTLVSEDGAKVLFTRNERDGLILSVADIKSGEIIELPIQAIAEKCVWSEIDENIIYCGASNTFIDGDALDLWYQGLISFSDSVWMIDIKTQTTKILIDPINIVNKEIDIIKLILSPDENYIFFINKDDSTLWQLRRSE
ncbi:hypothetical protein COT82_01300 [Candidatus Campbellbacteria bacterium CG10_big_fil_rev_8_21_14_0_10_35_52]|uniref:Uncharacterized protein n=1 Tax=Candidatus Campbellbacteria bacterium CG10_big_fil_rev_8_21_14_0_10_35_52 TaxID=1974527 RepID=A0A2M6WVH3_9BACT|nr:MAG: hypothetical protein COT82_01300 [Candidatus Campbellbacteria bacterium CG10_big_fil_rev_8_21_14_0_10_35_52]